ncbi:hypothetical protein HanRHA438_Chr12g0536551 [Helianthus annuus]|nr:hypothetical protein HanRHA438_Chr12g0536551 [Helianthus annuus]
MSPEKTEETVMLPEKTEETVMLPEKTDEQIAGMVVVWEVPAGEREGREERVMVWNCGWEGWFCFYIYFLFFIVNIFLLLHNGP